MNYDPIAGVVDQGAVAPRGRSDQTQFRGVTLTSKPEEIRGVLDEYMASHSRGEEAAVAFVEAFSADLKRRRIQYTDVSGGTIEEWILLEIQRDTNLLELMRTELNALQEENRQVLDLFETRASVLLDRLLSANEAAVLSERYRYRLERTSTTVTTWHVDADGQWYSEDEIEYSYSMPASPESAGLSAAAGHLVEKLTVLRSKAEAMHKARDKLLYSQQFTSDLREFELALSAANAELKDAERDYDLSRAEPEAYFPILAAFTEVKSDYLPDIDRPIEALQVLATAPSPAAAEKFYEDTAQRIANAEKVRDDIDDEDLTIWDLPSVVALTQLGLDLPQGSRQWRIVDDKINRIDAAKKGREEALMLVAIALGLLAMPLTGGASLSMTGAFIASAAAVGELGLAAWLTIDHLQEYRRKQAQAGTHFDRAQALSQEDPSMSWLAWDILDIAFAGFDVVGAFRALSRTLRPLIAARREAQTAQQIIAANEQFAKAKAKIEAEYAKKLASLEKSERLASRVTERAKAIAEEQAQQLAEATKNWKRSLDEATQALVESPGLKKAFEQMDPEVRAVLTRCGD